MAVLDAKHKWENMAITSVSANAVESISASTVVDLGAAGKDGWGNAKFKQLGGDLRWNVLVEAISNSGSSTVVEVTLKTHSASSAMASGVDLAIVSLPKNAAVGTRRSIGVPYGKYQRYICPEVGARGGKCNTATLSVWLGFGQDFSKGDI